MCVDGALTVTQTGSLPVARSMTVATTADRSASESLAPSPSNEVLHQIRRHRHAAIGDGGGDQRVLQRGHRDVRWPMLDWPSAASSGIGPTVMSATGSGIGGGVESDAERRAVRPQRVGAGLDAEFDERRVARPRERVAQRRRRRRAARRCRCSSPASRCCSGSVICGAAVSWCPPSLRLQRGRGGEHLERRPGRVGLRDRAVDQRLVRVGAQPLPRRPTARRRRGWRAGSGRRRVPTPWSGSCRCSARSPRPHRCSPCSPAAGVTRPAALPG